VGHHLLLRADGERAIPFVLPTGTAGYASHGWVVDLLAWADDAPRKHRDRIFGLLLGYGADAIRQFEELRTTLGSVDQGGVMDKFDANRGCAICGNDEPAAYEYHDGPRDIPPCATVEPHLHRTCRNCGAEWPEAPANA